MTKYYQHIKNIFFNLFIRKNLSSIKKTEMVCFNVKNVHKKELPNRITKLGGSERKFFCLRKRNPWFSTFYKHGAAILNVWAGIKTLYFERTLTQPLALMSIFNTPIKMIYFTIFPHKITLTVALCCNDPAPCAV